MKNKFSKIAIGSIILISLAVSGYSKSVNYTFNAFKPNTTINNINKNNSSKITDENVQSLISKIKVEEPANSKKYNRDEYTSAYQKYVFNGETYRSIRAYAFRASVHYVNGVYTSPYDDKIYAIKQTDYDHIIPLSYADEHGASAWSDIKKKAYADNPTVGIDVDLHANRIKGDKGPSKWLPEKNVVSYCYTWIYLANKFNLSIAPDDMKIIKEKLSRASTSELKVINAYN